MELKAPIGATRKRRIKGRGAGSGNGKTAGRGHKGQNARSGGGVRAGFEGGQMPLYRRVALRGFSNYPFKRDVIPVSVATLGRHFESGDTVTLETLKAKRLVRRNARYAKVLSDGKLEKKLTISGLAVSATAREKIEAAGGTIQAAEEANEPREDVNNG